MPAGGFVPRCSEGILVRVQAQCKKELKSLAKEISQAEGKLKAAAEELRERQAAVDAIGLRVEQAQRRLEV
jgi:hypothetical protein